MAAALTTIGAGPSVATGAEPPPVSPRVAERAVTMLTSALLVARYSFERNGGIVDESGRGHTLRRVASGGGRTRIISHATGKAVAFPRACTGRRCPRAVLQSPNAADLNPGTRRFAYGAVVRLARWQTSGGQNVVQKGYSRATSQYKMQVDGRAGKPSCVVVDVYRPTIRIARSNRTVADNRWHSVECRRSGTVLAILVDGTVAGRTWVPAGLRVTNNRPLSIGGKGAYQDNDQFQGAVDDVWVTIG